MIKFVQQFVKNNPWVSASIVALGICLSVFLGIKLFLLVFGAQLINILPSSTVLFEAMLNSATYVTLYATPVAIFATLLADRITSLARASKQTMASTQAVLPIPPTEVSTTARVRRPKYQQIQSRPVVPVVNITDSERDGPSAKQDAKHYRVKLTTSWVPPGHQRTRANNHCSAQSGNNRRNTARN